MHGRATDKAYRRDLISAEIARLFADFVSVIIAVKPSDVLCDRGNLVAHSREVAHHQVAKERLETFQ